MVPLTDMQPGDIFLTAYGVAVVVKKCENQILKTLIWREAGKSIGSASTAYLRHDSFVKQLPVAPGMITTKVNSSEERLLIHSYSPCDDTFVVSTAVKEDSLQFVKRASIISIPEDDRTAENSSSIDDELYTIKREYLTPAKCAKFYPLIDELISRGNRAAISTKALIDQNPAISKLVSKLSDQSDQSLPEKDGMMEKISDEWKEAGAKLKTKLPKSDEVKEIYTMLRDEDLTVLLGNAQQRLKHLVSEELPDTREAALREMGLVIDKDDNNSLMKVTKEKALGAINKVLTENLDVDVGNLTSSLGDTFGTMFDSLTTLADSDETLNSILKGIDEKTTVWQGLTGRLRETRSSSLFAEGAQRIRGRVGNLFSPQQLKAAEQTGAKFTKAFTEGDAAMARLKSLELTDSVRTRLFEAIEVRSDTYGGLDGMIAGAITALGEKGSGEGLQSVIMKLQKSVSSNTANANESLISLLSGGSKYQDIAILRIEQVLQDIEEHFGRDVSPEQIAAMARGEGGTGALFAPIARNATKEIEKQLDIAEESIDDQTMLAILSHVRNIISGDLSMNSLVDEVTKILDNEDVVRAGEAIAQKGEGILDAIENASENRAVSDMIEVVEKAGLTKDAVLDKIENLDVDVLLDTAGEAMSDEKKRLEILSSATDSALDFLLKILPSMPVPPFEGVKDGLIYSIQNLSMHGFKLKKEDIMVEIAGIRAATRKVDDLESKEINLSQHKPEIAISIRRKIDCEKEIITRSVKATELLVIDVRNIAATFEKASWSFEQTSFPYMKGEGYANVSLLHGCVRLVFELRKKEKTSMENGIKKTGWQPVLCLHKNDCSIEDVDLSFEGGGGLTWIMNRLANIFRGPLKEYVVNVISNVLTEKSGWLLENLNSILSQYWDLILRTANLTMDDLIVASKDDIIAASPDPYENEVDLVWNDFVPLGMNLLMNDKSGFVKVVDFPRGSQSRKVAIQKGLDPDIFVGATILGVNGTRVVNREAALLALKDSSRPKTVKFSLANDSDAKRMKMLTAQDKQKSLQISKDETRIMKSLKITKEGPIGIIFEKSMDGSTLSIKSFDVDGLAQAGERNGNIIPGDLLTHVNDILVMGGEISRSLERAYKLLESDGTKRPLSLGFADPYLQKIEFKESDLREYMFERATLEEFVLDEVKVENGTRKIRLKGFKEVDGAAEAGGAFIGDELLFINGNPIRGCSIEKLRSILKGKEYPMGLTFTRQTKSFEKHTINVMVSAHEQLGCRFKRNNEQNKFVVSEFEAVPGFFQNEVKAKYDNIHGMTIQLIQGEQLPSYASSDMIHNAMKRGWKRDKKLEIVLCNEQILSWISSLSSP